MQQLEKSFLWIVKIGLWLIPLIPLYVSSSMLFPFITGKNFTFRIITEIIFALWVGLAIARPEYRPKLTPLFKIVTAFVAIVFLADLLSPNPYRAFFSNYERMEGFMMLGHLYLYFVMLTSVFKTRRDWLIFFHVSLAASLRASYFGLLQRLGYRISLQGGFRVDSTIGNPTYFAAYLLFHIWLLGILIYRYWKTWWRAALYAAILLFELVIIYFTATRGVVLALAFAVPPFLAALVYFWNRIAASPRVGGPTGWPLGRKIAAGLLAASIAVPLLLWSIRQTEFVQSGQALRRLTNYSLGEGTIQDRMRIWKMSLRGVRDRPILGWGQENYYLVFQKYYDPGLYGAEPWFDRSHNVFLDWAVHAGIPGLGAYLGILGVVIWRVVRAMRKGQGIFFEGLALLGLFAGDFFQKLFVFDNLSSYLLFFAFLAYTDGFAAGSAVSVSADEGYHRGPVPHTARGSAAAGVVGALFLAAFTAAAGYFLHLKPIRQSKALIRVFQVYRESRAQPAAVEAVFGKALAYNSFGTTEVREQVANIASEIIGNDKSPAEERRRFAEFAADELRKETLRPAKDVKHLLMLGSTLHRAATLDTKYLPEAETALSEAFRLSPTKQIAAFELAQLYLNTGKYAEAAAVLETAWRAEPTYKQAVFNLWAVAVLAKRSDLAAEVERSFGLENLGEASALDIARAYHQAEDFDGELKMYGRLVAISPANPEYRTAYAALLAKTGKER